VTLFFCARFSFAELPPVGWRKVLIENRVFKLISLPVLLQEVLSGKPTKVDIGEM